MFGTFRTYIPYFTVVKHTHIRAIKPKHTMADAEVIPSDMTIDDDSVSHCLKYFG
jgi:hypothetical protein